MGLGVNSYALIIGTDDDLRRYVVETLQAEGLEIIEAMDSDAGLDRVIEQEPEFIIMVEETPPVDALDALPLLRRLTRAPIIVVDGGGETEIVEALLQGADIYLTWSAGSQELLSRVRALLRRSNPNPAA